MLTTKIKCFACGHEGEIEVAGSVPGADAGHLFSYLGREDRTGNMFFSCPRCGWELVVGPLELLGDDMIRGIPLYREEFAAHAVVVDIRSSVLLQAGNEKYSSMCG